MAGQTRRKRPRKQAATPDAVLVAARLEAEDSGAFIRAVAALEWRHDRPGEDCPADMTPDEHALAGWLDTAPAEARAEAGRILAEIMAGDLAELAAQAQRLRVMRPRADASPDPLAGRAARVVNGIGRFAVTPCAYWIAMTPAERNARELRAVLIAAGARRVLRLSHVIAAWRDLQSAGATADPVGPLVAAWQAEALARRAHFQPATRGSVMEWHRADAGDMRLLDPGDAPPVSSMADEAQMILPLFSNAAIQDDGSISWLLALYEMSGGALNGRKGLPPALVMAVGAMAHLHVRSRDSDFHRLYFPMLKRHRDHWQLYSDGPQPWPAGTTAIEEWLYPKGGMAKPARDWTRIRDGLRDMGQRLAYLPIPGLGDVAWLFPGVIPTAIDAPIVELVVRIPASAAKGTRFDWPRFTQYASANARKARAYLSAIAHMGRSAHDGEFLTRQLPARVLDRHGNPIRQAGGRPKRDLAVGLEDNPHAARFVRPLSDRALARMCGYPNPTRLQLLRARQTFAELAADGVLELVRDGDGYRLFGPPPRP